MKLTKKEIFRLAHRYAKRLEGDYKARFTWALKYVYKCIELINTKVELKGSPKQIKWANEIRNSFDYKGILFECYVDYDEYRTFENMVEFIKAVNTIENASVIICLAYQTPAGWFTYILRYKQGKKKLIEIGKEFNPNFFIIDEQGRYIQTDWRGIPCRRQYYDWK